MSRRASAFNRMLGGFIKDKTVPQGAATTVFACVCPRIGTEGLRGAYLKDCSPAPPTSAGQDEDKKVRRELWKVTDQQLQEALVKAGLA